MLSHFGQSRTSIQPRHALLTPESYERITLPAWEGAELIYGLSPAMGARLSMYLAEVGDELSLPATPTGVQRFVLVLAGKVLLAQDGSDQYLESEHFAFLPAGSSAALTAAAGAKLVVLEWEAAPAPQEDPIPVVSGTVDIARAQPLKGDSALLVQNLLPKEVRFDAEVNIMNFAPGASLPYVETHFMEHGLLFLDGGGIYRLGDRWYPVTKGDAIWMGAHELQWFGALGKEPSRYLIWKNYNRRP